MVGAEAEAKGLVTFPGRFGDLLWAMQTVRGLAEILGGKLDVQVSWKYRGIVPLLRMQPYINFAWGDPDWLVEETAPMSPAEPPSTTVKDLLYGRRVEVEVAYPRVFHLGYTQWPGLALPNEVAANALSHFPEDEIMRGETSRRLLQLGTPWITNPKVAAANSVPTVIIGWSEEWAELKLGIVVYLLSRFPGLHFHWVVRPEGRYSVEVLRFLERAHQPFFGFHVTNSWPLLAQILQEGQIFIGCQSSLWVLANAVGTRAKVVVEPSRERWHQIFYPEGLQGNHRVLGSDGNPTFDGRHIGDALETALRGMGAGVGEGERWGFDEARGAGEPS